MLNILLTSSCFSLITYEPHISLHAFASHGNVGLIQYILYSCPDSHSSISQDKNRVSRRLGKRAPSALSYRSIKTNTRPQTNMFSGTCTLAVPTRVLGFSGLIFDTKQWFSGVLSLVIFAPYFISFHCEGPYNSVVHSNPTKWYPTYVDGKSQSYIPKLYLSMTCQFWPITLKLSWLKSIWN